MFQAKVSIFFNNSTFSYEISFYKNLPVFRFNPIMKAVSDRSDSKWILSFQIKMFFKKELGAKSMKESAGV